MEDTVKTILVVSMVIFTINTILGIFVPEIIIRNIIKPFDRKLESFYKDRKLDQPPYNVDSYSKTDIHSTIYKNSKFIKYLQWFIIASPVLAIAMLFVDKESIVLVKYICITYLSITITYITLIIFSLILRIKNRNVVGKSFEKFYATVMLSNVEGNDKDIYSIYGRLVGKEIFLEVINNKFKYLFYREATLVERNELLLYKKFGMINEQDE